MLRLRHLVIAKLLIAASVGAGSGTAVAADDAFTPDFAAFLAASYPDADFAAASAGVDSAFGGRAARDEALTHVPIVFVHGTTDRAIGGPSGGWTAAIDDLLGRGYRASEIYALTWGDGREASAINNVHDLATVGKVRRFLEAVLAYTGAEKIHVVGHSMGVTLARRAIKGGMLEGQSLGAPLTEHVEVFLGLAGANAGVGACLSPFSDFLRMCSRVNGFHPESQFLAELNADPTREAALVYALWSDGDEVLNRAVIGRDNPVPASVTAKIAGQDGEYTFAELSHLGTRDETLATQWQLLGVE